MDPTRVLCYPWIDVHDAGWLKTAILYWDKIYTMVPAGIEKPYVNPVSKVLWDHGLLEPLLIDRSNPAVQQTEGAVLKEIVNGIEGNVKSRQIQPAPSNDDFTQEWRLREFMTLHRLGKVGAYTDLHIAPEDSSLNDAEWVRLPTHLAAVYLTVLAANLAKHEGLAIATPEPGLGLVSDFALSGTMAGQKSNVSFRGKAMPADQGDFKVVDG